VRAVATCSAGDPPAYGGTVELTVDTAARYLHLGFEQMLEVAARVGDEGVNVRPLGADTNAIAALVVHCCGVTEFWLGHVGCGRPTHRDRDAEFTTTASVAELGELVAATLGQAEADLAVIAAGVDSAHADRRSALVDGSDSALVLHVVEELFQHLGHCEIAADALRAR
jgi:hypothetical protein